MWTLLSRLIDSSEEMRSVFAKCAARPALRPASDCAGGADRERGSAMAGGGKGREGWGGGGVGAPHAPHLRVLALGAVPQIPFEAMRPGGARADSGAGRSVLRGRDAGDRDAWGLCVRRNWSAAPRCPRRTGFGLVGVEPRVYAIE